MRITEKTTRRQGHELRVVEMIPERMEGTWRSKCGLAGALLLGGVLSLALGFPPLDTILRFKLMALGGLGGGLLLATSLGRSVYRTNDHLNVRKGFRFLGFTMWEPRIPLTGDLVLDISRTDASEIFVAIRRPESAGLLLIGPFIDGDQAVEACKFLRPRQRGVGDEPSLNPAKVIHDLEGTVPNGVAQFTLISLFLTMLFVAWQDRSPADAAVSISLGTLVFLAAVRWLAPRAGVDERTDIGESVEFWIRSRPFLRLEFRKTLNSAEPPIYLRSKYHWPTVGWLLMIPLFIGAVVIFYRMNT